jgi:hypothetical protein
MENIIRMVHSSPHISSRQIAIRLNFLHTIAWRTLHSYFEGLSICIISSKVSISKLETWVGGWNTSTGYSHNAAFVDTSYSLTRLIVLVMWQTTQKSRIYGRN